MKYHLAYHSIAGGRATNQDRVACVERDDAVLLILGDGLGGHKGGAIAAETLVDTAQHAFESIRQPVITKPSAFLALTIMQAHKAIVSRGQTMTPPITPRTTSVLCLIQNGYAYWAHVGDSRLYHFRDGEVLTRTLDHTVTEQMHIDGVLSEEEMKRHPEKARLLKALGGPQIPNVTLGEETRLHPGDVLFLCTDGVWEALSAPQLATLLKRDSLDEATEEILLAAENQMKQRADNLSAIAFRWTDSVTSARPLQPRGMREADHKTLIEDVRVQAAEKKVREHSPPAGQKSPAGKKKSLDATIDELEEFLSRFEKE